MFGHAYVFGIALAVGLAWGPAWALIPLGLGFAIAWAIS